MGCRTGLVLSKGLSCVRVWVVAVLYASAWTRKSFNSSKCFKVSSPSDSLGTKYRLWSVAGGRTTLRFFRSGSDSDSFFTVACESSPSSFNVLLTPFPLLGTGSLIGVKNHWASLCLQSSNRFRANTQWSWRIRSSFLTSQNRLLFRYRIDVWIKFS